MSKILLQKHRLAVIHALKNGYNSNLADFYIAPAPTSIHVTDPITETINKITDNPVPSSYSNFRKLQNVKESDFNLGNELGKGAFGTTYKAIHKDTQLPVVVKFMNKYTGTKSFEEIMAEQVDPNAQGETTLEAFENEVAVMKHVQNKCQDYILCYLNSFITPNHFVLVTEYVKGMELTKFLRSDDYMNNMTFGNEIMTIWKNLVAGMKLLHSMNVIHSDTKPGNIMINPDTKQIKYIDFGVSCSGMDCHPFGRTPVYYPFFYEEFHRKNFADDGSWTRVRDLSFEEKKKADVFALGLTMTELMADKPFPSPLADMMQFNDIPEDKSLFLFKTAQDKTRGPTRLRTFFFRTKKQSQEEIKFSKVLLTVMSFRRPNEILPIEVIQKILDSGNTNAGLQHILNYFGIQDKSSFSGKKVSDLLGFKFDPNSPLHIYDEEFLGHTENLKPKQFVAIDYMLLDER